MTTCSLTGIEINSNMLQLFDPHTYTYEVSVPNAHTRVHLRPLVHPEHFRGRVFCKVMGHDEILLEGGSHITVPLMESGLNGSLTVVSFFVRGSSSSKTYAVHVQKKAKGTCQGYEINHPSGNGDCSNKRAKGDCKEVWVCSQCHGIL